MAVYATVTDNAGHLVPDLTREDFELFDDGVLRPIGVFQSSPQPVVLAVMRDVSPSMRRTPSTWQSTTTALKSLVGALLPQDRVCFGVFSGTVLANRHLTSNHSDLLHIVSISPPDDLPDGSVVWDAITAGASLLKDETGRRLVMIVTDGGDFGSQTSASSAFELLDRSDISLYFVAMSQRAQPGPTSKLLDFAAVASETGGGYDFLTPKDNVGAAFARIGDEIHHQYLIGFTPRLLDGKKHRVSVRARNGLHVKSRTSYVARRVAR